MSIKQDPLQKLLFAMLFKMVVKIFAIFTGKHLCLSLFLINLQL